VRIVSVGEILWDVFQTQEILGGAPLNFSVNSHRLGNSVIMVSAVGRDERGKHAIELVRSLGLTTELILTTSLQSTGIAIVNTDADGNATFVIDRPAAFDFVYADDQVTERVREFRPEWIYFGTLTHTNPQAERVLNEMIRDSSEAKCFYDMNLRKGHWNLGLVERLSRVSTVVKLNDTEAELLFGLLHQGQAFSLEEFCTHWSTRFGVKTICVTLGDKGCAIFGENILQYFPGYQIKVVDTVGAGDAFAAGFLHGLHGGWTMERIAAFANSLGATVASRPGATPPWSLDDLEEIRSTVGGAPFAPR